MRGRQPLRRIVIIGSSAAGVNAARSLRRSGFDGNITMISSDADSPYSRPALSKGFMAGVTAEPALQLPGLADLSVERLSGCTATALNLADRRVIVDAEHVRFDGLVIATGASPRRILAADQEPNVFTLRTLSDARKIRQSLSSAAHVLVVGAGFLGLELAATCRGLGHDVTVVEPFRTPLIAAMGEAVGGVVADAHRDAGIRMHLGDSVKSLVRQGQSWSATTASGRRISADIVIVGVGAIPATRWLDGSGIPLKDGILCAPNCSVRGIDRVVAAGDVARWWHPVLHRYVRVEHWENAVAQGAAAAQTLLGLGKAFEAIPYFWTDQEAVKLRAYGVSQNGRAELVLLSGSLAERKFAGLYVHQERIVGAVVMNDPPSQGRVQRILREAWMKPAGPILKAS